MSEGESFAQRENFVNSIANAFFLLLKIIETQKYSRGKHGWTVKQLFKIPELLVTLYEILMVAFSHLYSKFHCLYLGIYRLYLFMYNQNRENCLVW